MNPAPETRLRPNLTLWQVLGSCSILLALMAIVSPVFAKLGSQTTSAANLKQLATAMIAYSEDYSGTLPLAFGRSATTGLWAWNFRIAVPAGWPPSFDEDRRERDQWAWINSTKPYYEDSRILALPGLPKQRVLPDDDYANARYPWYDASMSMNGLLSSYPLASIVEPSKLTLLWSGLGRVQLEGFTVSNPALRCQQPNLPCVYQPAENGCSNSTNGTTSSMFTVAGSVWVTGRSSLFVSVDTSLRSIPVAAITTTSGSSQDGSPFTDWRYDPYTGYDPQGFAGFYWWDGCHIWLFRPDYDFES